MDVMCSPDRLDQKAKTFSATLRKFAGVGLCNAFRFAQPTVPMYV